MTRHHTETFNRDDEAETEVEVEYTYYPGAPERGPSYASGGEPADPPEVEIYATRIAGVDVVLSEAENMKFVEWLLENHEEPGPDPDDARDRDNDDRLMGVGRWARD